VYSSRRGSGLFMNVVHIKDWQQRRPRPGTGVRTPSGPPTHLRVVGGRQVDGPILPPGTDLHDAHAAQEERRRMRQNLGAVAVVVLIVAVGGWLISQIQTASRIQACIDYGHRNCLPLNIGHTSSQAIRP
jgi:hypothetical protein